MNVVTFTKKFHEIEKNLDTFSFQDQQGNYYWDAVRFFVFNYVYVTLTGNKYIYGQSPLKGNILKTVVKKIIAFVAKFLLFSSFKYSRKNILFINCSRASSQGEPFDSLLKPLIHLMNSAPLKIETFPVKNLFEFFTNTRFLLTAHNVDFGVAEKENLSKFNQELNKTFGLTIDISDIVLENIPIYLSQLTFYRALFSKLKIQQVFMVQNGIQKGLFKAAKEYGVVVNEMQHGYVGYTHPAYSYPASILNSDKVLSPTRLLTFSDFWQQGYYSPIKEFMVIGKQQVAQVKPNNKNCQEVLIISASLYHENLSGLLKNIANKQQKIEFKYKLHPNQFIDKKLISDEFSKFENITVISNEETIEVCLKKSLHVLCIQSTVVYEALQDGSFVYCYKRQDYNYHDNVIGVPGFSLIDDATEFIQLMAAHNTDKAVPTSDFFAPYNPECIKALL
jgi:hypothetical protein